MFDLDGYSENVLSRFSDQATNPYCPTFCATQTHHKKLAHLKCLQRARSHGCLWEELQQRRGWLCVCWPADQEASLERAPSHEQGRFCFWQKVWILHQSLSTPSKIFLEATTGLLSFSHDGFWLFPSFLSCQVAPPAFGKGEDVLASGWAPSWAGMKAAQVSRVPPWCHAPLLPVWLPKQGYGHFPECTPWVFKLISSSELLNTVLVRAAVWSAAPSSASQSRCRNCLGAPEKLVKRRAPAAWLKVGLEVEARQMREPVRALQRATTNTLNVFNLISGYRLFWISLRLGWNFGWLLFGLHHRSYYKVG